MVGKVECFCAKKRSKSISVDSGERACINCIWYQQYYREGRGNVKTWVPTSTGYCLLNDQKRGALEQPCDKYEGYEDKQRNMKKEDLAN